MLYVIIAEGFEEIEALTTVDILRRLNLEVRTVSINGARQVIGAHGIRVMVDQLLRINEFQYAQAIILPGGMPGAENIGNSTVIHRLLKAVNDKGTLIAAICAAPMVLGACGILKGKRATCYPGFEDKLTGATTCTDMVVEDGNIITAKGPGASAEFAFAIARRFVSEAEIEQVRRGMFLP